MQDDIARDHIPEHWYKDEIKRLKEIIERLNQKIRGDDVGFGLLRSELMQVRAERDEFERNWRFQNYELDDMKQKLIRDQKKWIPITDGGELPIIDDLVLWGNCHTKAVFQCPLCDLANIRQWTHWRELPDPPRDHSGDADDMGKKCRDCGRPANYQYGLCADCSALRATGDPGF